VVEHRVIRVARIGSDRHLDQVDVAVAVAVLERSSALGFFVVGQAVPVRIEVEKIRDCVEIHIDRRRLDERIACLLDVGVAVSIAVVVERVGGPVIVSVVEPLVAVADGVTVAVGVSGIESAFDLLVVLQVVVVRVEIEVVRHEIAVRVEAVGDLGGVGDAVTIGIGVEEVGGTVVVGVDGRCREILVAGLETVADAVTIGIGVEIVGRPVVVAVLVGSSFVTVGNRVAVGIRVGLGASAATPFASGSRVLPRKLDDVIKQVIAQAI
jgi:hypothetical protein